MNHISPQELNGLHNRARRRAQELRREAIEDFWRGADAAWAATQDSARRSAQRLAHRLAQHVALRREQAEPNGRKGG